MARVKFNGTKKATLTWNSMGKCYSYVVNPGQIFTVPEDQVYNACAAGRCIILTSLTKNIKPSTIIKKKKIEKPSVVKVVKSLPVVEESVVEPKEDTVEIVEVKPSEYVEVSVPEEVEEIKVEEEESEIIIDYTSIRKDDLKSMCKDRGLKISGNRDDLIARLVMNDKGIIVEE